MVYYSLGFILVGLAFMSISYDDTILGKVIAEIREHSDIAQTKPDG